MNAKTPICDFVNRYAESGAVRLHMPGHKGRKLLGCEEYDITEIDGADELFAPEGIIKQSEANASLIFGCPTFYSACGSTLSIQAMMYLLSSYACSKGEEPLILAARNAHRAFINSAMLLRTDIEWIYPDSGDDSYISCIISPDGIRRAIENCSGKPTAVYITSPDYLGNIAPIKEIAEVCREKGVLLAVDCAHGAYLKFMPQDMHPCSLGADICCTSAHKTLPVLTGGAYLHIGKHAPAFFAEGVKSAMALFSTSSPSYLILQSLDMMNAQSEIYKKKLSEFMPRAERLRSGLEKCGYTLAGDEKIKITLKPKEYGYSGVEIAGIIMKNGIYPEFYDNDFVVLMLSAYNTDEELDRAADVLCKVERRKAITDKAPCAVRAKKTLEPYQVLMNQSETLPIELCEGRICALSVISCPPAVPIAVCGELIDREVIKALKYYGMQTCTVVKESTGNG